ncbi:MAG: DsrE/DsrF/DrsH-like family protein [Burkholderiales bacterium]|nr:MAG: DsrE/DsrF/DrsH-like family protein [Burkholderiales bacterium]
METKKMAIIATKGTLDWVYPPLILSSTAAALGYEVQVFCTFYGLSLLRKDLSGIKISPLGNPAMPMPMPMPVLVQALPGVQAMATAMMKKTMRDKGVASVEELRSLCLEADVKFIACQMTVDLFDYKRSDFIDGIDFGGATTFLGFAGEADISLYI